MRVEDAARIVETERSSPPGTAIVRQLTHARARAVEQGDEATVAEIDEALANLPQRADESAPSPDLWPALRRGAYETLGGTIGGAVGAGAGPVGLPVGMALGTGMGFLADKAMHPQDYSGMGALDTATQTMQSGMLGPILGAGGEQLGSVAGRGLRALGPSGKPGSLQRLEAFERLGIPPNLAAVSQRPTHMMEFEALSRMPFAAERIGGYAERAVGAMQGTADDIARAGGRVPLAGSPWAAGETARKGAERNLDRFLSDSVARHQAVSRMIPKDTTVDLSGYIKSLEGSVDQFAEAPNLGRSFISPKVIQRHGAALKDVQILDDAGNVIGLKPVPWKTADMIRRKTGEEIGRLKHELMPEISAAELKSQYAAITGDMEQALGGTSEDVLKAWNSAKEYTRRGLKVAEETIQKVADAGDARSLFEAVKVGNYDKARQIAGAIPREDRWALRGEIVRQMGLSPPGIQNATGDQWSPMTFLTNYNNLNKADGGRTKRLLFAGDRELERNLDSLASVVGDVKALSIFRNWSGTAPASKVVSMMEKAGGIGAVALAVLDPTYAALAGGGVGGMTYAAKLMTDPAFVRWAISPARRVVTPNGLASSLTRLATIPGAEGLADSLRGLLTGTGAPEGEQQPMPVPTAPAE